MKRKEGKGNISISPRFFEFFLSLSLAEKYHFTSLSLSFSSETLAVGEVIIADSGV
jgi:hypothetical protein